VRGGSIPLRTKTTNGYKMFKNRSTIDIVIILLTSMVALILILATVGIIVGKLTHPTTDFAGGEKVVGSIVQTIVGALVGFVGGRATGRMEANGGQH
jgi:hypothetical protein